LLIGIELFQYQCKGFVLLQCLSDGFQSGLMSGAVVDPPSSRYCAVALLVAGAVL
jgi:hypothetical protein